MASEENPNSATFGKIQTREIGETIQVYSPMEFPDSAACGKRKRGIDALVEIDFAGCGGSAPSRQVSEFKGGSAMEKPPRQVSEFKDTYGIYEAYIEKMPIESEEFEDTDIHSLYSSGDEEEEELKNATFPREAVVKYIEQVRHSFGFDVDVTLPYWVEDLRAYFPYDLSDTSNRARANTAAKLAIDEINADMNGKSYELVEIVKVVSTQFFRLKLLTLTAKKVGEDAVVTIQAIVKCYIGGGLELDQWRFKPDAPAADDA